MNNTESQHRMCRRSTDLLGQVKRGDEEKVLHRLLTEIWTPEELEIQTDCDGSALFWASLRGYTLIVELLLTLGANVNSRSLASGGTPLHGAADNGREDVARLLLKWGADVMAKNFFQDTSCHLAAYRGNAEVVSLLLRAGTDCNAKNSRSNSVLDEAKCGQYMLAEGNHSLVQYLINSHQKALSPSVNSLTEDGIQSILESSRQHTSFPARDTHRQTTDECQSKHCRGCQCPRRVHKNVFPVKR